MDAANERTGALRSASTGVLDRGVATCSEEAAGLPGFGDGLDATAIRPWLAGRVTGRAVWPARPPTGSPTAPRMPRTIGPNAAIVELVEAITAAADSAVRSSDRSTETPRPEVTSADTGPPSIQPALLAGEGAVDGAARSPLGLAQLQSSDGDSPTLHGSAGTCGFVVLAIPRKAPTTSNESPGRRRARAIARRPRVTAAPTTNVGTASSSGERGCVPGRDGVIV